MEALTIERGGEETLPVFSFREEAEMFLELGGFGGGWRVRGSCAGEVVSILCGPCANVREVALDPLPEMLSERTVGLVALDRERFMMRALSRVAPPAITRAGTPFVDRSSRGAAYRISAAG